MKFTNKLAALSVFSLAIPLYSHAQSGADDRVSYRVSLNQDAFFGFYPTFSAGYKANERIDWTVYGIIWTTPSFGTGGGSGLWTEFGSGVNIRTLGGKLTWNPQLGLLNGKLLSNGSYAMALEGIVPNITVNLSTDRAEGEFYLGRYTALRKGKTAGAGGALVTVPVQNNFLHYWVNGGARFSKLVSAGLHYEQLDSSPSGTGAPRGAGVYKWFGPYVQATMGKFSVRFTAGPDVMSRPAADGTGSFYKLTATYNFP